MEKLKIKVINNSQNELPNYETSQAAGADIRANLPEGTTIVLSPMHRVLIPTGLKIELPDGYECQIRPRSGLALKHGITVLNTPGCVDADYRGEIKVILINLGDEPFCIKNGDRIAQMMIVGVKQADFEIVTELSQTDRGDGAFGHTGIKS